MPLGLLNAAADAVGFTNDKTSLAFQIDSANAAPNGSATVVARYKAAGLTVDKLLMAKQMLNKGTSNNDEKGNCFTTKKFIDLKVSKVLMNPPFALKKGDEKEYKFIDFALNKMKKRLFICCNS